MKNKLKKFVKNIGYVLGVFALCFSLMSFQSVKVKADEFDYNVSGVAYMPKYWFNEDREISIDLGWNMVEALYYGIGDGSIQSGRLNTLYPQLDDEGIHIKGLFLQPISLNYYDMVTNQSQINLDRGLPFLRIFNDNGRYTRDMVINQSMYEEIFGYDFNIVITSFKDMYMRVYFEEEEYVRFETTFTVSINGSNYSLVTSYFGRYLESDDDFGWAYSPSDDNNINLYLDYFTITTDNEGGYYYYVNYPYLQFANYSKPVQKDYNFGDLINSYVSIPMTTLKEILNVNLLGTTLFAIFGTIVVVSLLIWLIKKFK